MNACRHYSWSGTVGRKRIFRKVDWLDRALWEKAAHDLGSWLSRPWSLENAYYVVSNSTCSSYRSHYLLHRSKNDRLTYTHHFSPSFQWMKSPKNYRLKNGHKSFVIYFSCSFEMLIYWTKTYPKACSLIGVYEVGALSYQFRASTTFNRTFKLQMNFLSCLGLCFRQIFGFFRGSLIRLSLPSSSVTT